MPWVEYSQRMLEQIPRGRQTLGIFELANLFDISSEALRKYEKQKIIQPARLENGYRKYSSWDLTKIIRARQMKHEGFSLDEVASQLEYCPYSFSSQIHQLEALRQDLQKEINYKKRLVTWLENRQNELVRAENLGEHCIIQRQACQYYCSYLVGNSFVDKSSEEMENLKNWINALPFARVCYVNSGTPQNTLSCLSLDENELSLYGLEHLHPDFVIPEQQYVVCIITAEHSPTSDTLTEAFVTAKQKSEQLGLELADYNIMQMIDYSQSQDSFYYRNIVMFPIV